MVLKVEPSTHVETYETHETHETRGPGHTQGTPGPLPEPGTGPALRATRGDDPDTRDPFGKPLALDPSASPGRLEALRAPDLRLAQLGGGGVGASITDEVRLARYDQLAATTS